MQPISLLTKGLISTLKYFLYCPLDVTIDYGEKIIELTIEDNELSVIIEQPILTIEAGQENIDVILDQPDVTVNT